MVTAQTVAIEWSYVCSVSTVWPYVCTVHGVDSFAGSPILLIIVTVLVGLAQPDILPQLSNLATAV